MAAATPAKAWNPSNYDPNTIKFYAGIGGSVASNLTGIPFDRFRVMVATDLTMAKSLPTHLSSTFATIGTCYTGGFARITMKSMAAQLNLYVPAEYRKDSPFLCSAAVGVGFAPILNVPRMLQLGRISGLKYPEIAKNLFTTSAGFKTYVQNTMIFAPGEGLRMMMCFGTKDFLFPRIGGTVDPNTLASPAMYAGKLALIAGPVVAAIETTAALATETISTVQADIKSKKPVEGAPQESFVSVLKKTVTPKYMSRCFMSLFAKNCVANTPLFWIMFMADFYAKISLSKLEAEKL